MQGCASSLRLPEDDIQVKGSVLSTKLAPYVYDQ